MTTVIIDQMKLKVQDLISQIRELERSVVMCEFGSHQEDEKVDAIIGIMRTLFTGLDGDMERLMSMYTGELANYPEYSPWHVTGTYDMHYDDVAAIFGHAIAKKAYVRRPMNDNCS